VIGKSLKTALIVMYTIFVCLVAGCGAQTAAWGGFSRFSLQQNWCKFWHSQIICQV